MNHNLKQTIYGIVNNNADATLLHNNANKASERIPVMRDMVAGEVAKELALTEILPRHIAKAHIDGDIHYHDLDYAPLFPMFNCMLVDLEGMLTQGFTMGNAEIETPRSITTATSITAQIIAQVASHIYGGTTIDRIDEVLAPYVKLSYEKHLQLFSRLTSDRDKAVVEARLATEKETYDAFQGLEYEINTLHTANGQTPFTTLGFGLGTSWEARLIQESILKIRLKGLGKTGRTAVFPKLVFGVKDGVNLKQGDINYDIKQLAIDCASKRMYPDMLSYDKLVEVTGGFKTPMGCRSFLGEFNDTHAGRNNLGVVSINIPRIAIEADGDLILFNRLLHEKIKIAKQALDTRVNRLREVKASVAPILYTEGACGVRLDPDDTVFSIFESGRASVSLGYIGLHEAVEELTGFPPHESEDGKQLALDIVTTLRMAVDSWKEADGMGWSLYSTPSESLCDRFARLDKAKYPDAETWRKGYYTNSFHQDVWAETSPMDKIDYESDFPTQASGGFISYVELPRVQENMQRVMVEAVWDYAYTRVPYLGVNIPIDVCHDCGHSGEADRSMDGYKCAHCGSSNMEVTMRVCGYLGAPNSRPFVDGKQAEVLGRVKHK